MIATPTELIHFIEIYQIKHISKAALRLGVSQPTLTQSLGRLEDKLGIPLFHRTKQGVVPTAQATRFYHQAKTLLDCWADVEKDVHTSQNEIAGHFTVGCHPSVGAYTLPQLMRRLSEKAPKIEISLTHDMSRKITEGVVSHQIDVGYIVNPARHPDLVLKKIGDDRVTFWKKKGATNLPQTLFADRNREQVEHLLGKTSYKQFRGWKLISTTNLELIRTMTRQGLGVGILPERVASVDGADLVMYDSNLPHRSDEIFLAYRPELLKSKAGQELVRLANFQL